MLVGCLSGSGRGPAAAGTYRFCVPGGTEPLPPDLQPEAAAGAGPFSFAQGALTDGHATTQLGWRAATVGEVGVDVCIDLERSVFVDRVILRQPAAPERPAGAPSAGTPAAGDVEAMGHVELAGLSCVEVYALGAGARVHRLVGRAGQSGAVAFPGGPVAVTVGIEARELIVRVRSPHRDIRLLGMEVWGAASDGPAVFPVPSAMEDQPGPGLRLGHGAAVAVGATASEAARFAATLLAEKLAERYGLAPRLLTAVGLSDHAIAVTSQVAAGADTVAAGLEAPPGPESYALHVGAGAARLAAHDRRGLIYGVEALLQLLTRRDASLVARPCLIRDTPRLPFRGVHLFLPAPDQIEYTKRLIRYLLAPMRLNTIFLELAGAMRFDRRPEIAAAWERNNRLAAAGQAAPVPHGGVGGGRCLTKAQVKDLVDYARAYGMEVIPEIQSLSHVQYLTMTYPEIAEAEVEHGYPDAYCPRHPLSRQIVFDMIDEVVELLGPLRYMHMGHDEVYTMAACPRCAGTPRDELFAQDVNAIHAHLQAKGTGMMIWADMLQPWQRYAGKNAATMIPKDIVLLEFVWYFRPWADTEDHLLRSGFQVIFGNCYSSHFTRYESRTSKSGIIGTQVSVWSQTSEAEMGRLGKLYDLLYSAHAAWSPHCQEELRWTLDRRISEHLAAMRPWLRGAVPGPARRPDRVSEPLDLSPYCTAPRRDPHGRYGAYDLSALPEAPLAWRGLQFQFAPGVVLLEPPGTRERHHPSEATVPIGRPVSGLVFAHVAAGHGRIPDPFGPRPVLGRYEMAYADGGVEAVDVEYGHHVAEWNRRHGAPLGPTFYRHAGYVATYPVEPLWQGKTPLAEDITVYALEWMNPYPERSLTAVRLCAAPVRGEVALGVVGITALLCAAA